MTHTDADAFTTLDMEGDVVQHLWAILKEGDQIRKTILGE
jgi:hypothetical protein